MKCVRNVLVEMRDGIRIAVDLYLPSDKARCGAVFYLGPYRKDDYILAGSMAHLPKLLTERGLALVIADARGTNDSEGAARVMFSEDEQQDCFELVEWIASQPWCNGNVGMTGVSYGFWTSVLTAALRPPHLRTIVPINGSVSWFYCVHEGGLPMSFGYHGNYLALMLSMNGSPPGLRDHRWQQLWDDHIQCVEPWGLDWFGRMADDASYLSSSLAPRYDQVNVPVFAIGGWWDRYPGDALKLAEKLSGPVKVLVGPWQHMRPDAGIPGPRADYDVVIRWFDHWLNDAQNAVMSEPRLTYYMQDFAVPRGYHPEIPGEWKHALAWPMPRATTQRWHLSADGGLQSHPVAAAASCSYDYDPTAGFCGGLSGGIYGGIAMPEDQRPEAAYSVVYRSPPLEENVEVLGAALVRLSFSSTARRMGVVARLCDVAPDGTIALVTRGYLNLAHRDGLDRPSHTQPGSVYDIRIALKATAYRFARGHRICLMVASADFPSLFPTPDLGTNTLHSGGDFQSYLELPIAEISSAVEAPPPPAGSPAPRDPPADRRFRIERHKNGTVEAVLEVRDVNQGLNCVIEHTQLTSTTVEVANPANARLHSESVYRYRYDSGEVVESIGRVEYRGSSTEIRAIASLAITHDGESKAIREWATTHHREFI
jgi:predicted acyl esterase